MRVKQLVTFKMGNKKPVSKGKKEESTTGDWERSKCTRAELLNLVAQGLLQSEEMVQWKPSFRQFVPQEDVDQIVIFEHFVKTGLALPASDFFHGLLYH
ncbi:retrotransposon protein, putative, Ty3-gypsy subclass [Panicum miliaceum]|uniref:Retrotransposon protein, putative, Ty3-gypsy subclass n=1 Tax=Panicum miliaceum TaxID=4540 RepID=A0A3L6Q6M3_PANMI|nr:retrotransposon protein, putative, Ty3-gypsy subclass [Panicum miliaceum]